MGVLGRLLLSRQQRQDAEKARHMIEAAFIEFARTKKLR